MCLLRCDYKQCTLFLASTPQPGCSSWRVPERCTGHLTITTEDANACFTARDKHALRCGNRKRAARSNQLTQSPIAMALMAAISAARSTVATVASLPAIVQALCLGSKPNTVNIVLNQEQSSTAVIACTQQWVHSNHIYSLAHCLSLHLLSCMHSCWSIKQSTCLTCKGAGPSFKLLAQPSTEARWTALHC